MIKKKIDRRKKLLSEKRKSDIDKTIKNIINKSGFKWIYEGDKINDKTM